MSGIKVKLFKRIKISAPSRLHLGLISMAHGRFRKYGGIGFAIQGFDTIIEACVGNCAVSQVKDLRRDGRAFSVLKIQNIRQILDRIAQSENLRTLEVRVFDSPPQNSGFGRSEEHTSELQSRPHLVCR